MKRMLPVLLSVLLVCCCAACAADAERPTAENTYVVSADAGMAEFGDRSPKAIAGWSQCCFIGEFLGRKEDLAFLSEKASTFEGAPMMVGEMAVERTLKGEPGDTVQFAFIEGTLTVEDYLRSLPDVNTEEEFNEVKEYWATDEQASQYRYVRCTSYYSEHLQEGKRYFCMMFDGKKQADGRMDYYFMGKYGALVPYLYEIDEEDNVYLPQYDKTVSLEELVEMVTG